MPSFLRGVQACVNAMYLEGVEQLAPQSRVFYGAPGSEGVVAERGWGCVIEEWYVQRACCSLRGWLRVRMPV